MRRAELSEAACGVCACTHACLGEKIRLKKKVENSKERVNSDTILKAMGDQQTYPGTQLGPSCASLSGFPFPLGSAGRGI